MGRLSYMSDCKALQQYKEYFMDKDEVDALKFRKLGCSTFHVMNCCPPCVEQLIKQRENNNLNPMPWPIDAKHLIYLVRFLIVMFLLMGPDMHLIQLRAIRNNIIEVSYLTTFGAHLFEKEGTTFYYRVEQILPIIGKKVMRAKRLINKLKLKT